MDKDKKENFRMGKVKMAWFSQLTQYAMLKFTYHQCFAHAQ